KILWLLPARVEILAAFLLTEDNRPGVRTSRGASHLASKPESRLALHVPALRWRVKAILPVAALLLVGVGVFVWVTLSLEGTTQEPARHVVIWVAAAGGVAICSVVLVVLALLIERPLTELQQKIARLEDGDLTVRVNFAGRQDEIGGLGGHFNEMVRQLSCHREER